MELKKKKIPKGWHFKAGVKIMGDAFYLMLGTEPMASHMLAQYSITVS